ncbi:MAG: HU family DNA-binding protein [Planctomycetota bacterium]
MPTTKRDIAREVADRSALTQAQASDAVQFTLEAIARALLREGRLELRNFGVFEVKERAARKARDPRTGETMDVPARRVVAFRAGRWLKEHLEDED